MLKHWQSHQEYLRFLHEAKVHFDSSQRKRLASEFASARDKLRLLDLDPVKAHLAPFYSTTGRPALNQPQIIRSLTLMLHLGVTSLTRWLNRLASDDLLAFLIGCSPSSLPPLGSYFDFINRLWLQNPAFERLGRKDLFPAHKNLKPSKKPSKGENFLTAIPVLLKSSQTRLFPEKNSRFIMKNSFRNFSALPLCSLRYTPDSFPLAGSSSLVTVPASIPTLSLMAIRFVPVPKTGSGSVPAPDIIPIRTPPGAGTVISIAFTSDILFICFPSITTDILSTSRSIYISLMHADMTASAGLFH